MLALRIHSVFLILGTVVEGQGQASVNAAMHASHSRNINSFDRTLNWIKQRAHYVRLSVD